MYFRKFAQIVSVLFITLTTTVSAQSHKTKIAGIVTDAETGNPLVGTSVVIAGTQMGTTTDAEGKFFLPLSSDKNISLIVSNIGYASKTIDNVNALNDQTYQVTLQRASNELTQVVVKSSGAKRESIASLYLQQKNSSAISDAISADVIKRSPDKNTGEVLKRVSGASVQDNKFVVIRGLNERYNSSLLNNSVLPSTEPDKKAFAFDIIPSSVVDKLVIYKSATPDLPGDFAGGAIKVSTKDYPTKKISELSVSIGYNSLTTFKNFYKGYPEGKLDGLGFFDNSRLIPGSYYHNKYNFINLTDAQKQAITKQFSNNYGYQSAYKSLPDISVSYTGGNTHLFNNNKKLGYIFSVGYSEGRKVSTFERDEFQNYKTLDYRYNTVNYDIHNSLSALLNLTYSFGKNKISLRNLFNNDFSKTLGTRNGYNVINSDNPFEVKSVNNEVAANGIINSVLEGLHALNNNYSIDWNVSLGSTYRWEPDQKIIAMHTEANSSDPSVYKLTLSNENSPEISNSGRIYSFLHENIYGANVNMSKQFNWLGQTQKIKIGANNYYRDRNAEVDAIGYSVLNSSGYRATIAESKNISFQNIFSPEVIDAYHLTIANIPANSTDYTGTALMNAGYVMLDNRFSRNIKLTWGVRAENYKQEIKTKNKPNNKLTNFDVLPSLLFTYSFNNKTNLRLAGSQSVNRPEFRELADYRVYNYDHEVIIAGEPNLVRSKNTNADLRYEWFPAAGEIISASVFYKHFIHPIEQVNLGNNVLSYANADNSNLYGAEVEARKKLDFIPGRFFDHLTLYTNAAYIKGSVQFDGVKINSSMQGQSPYLINTGLTYATTGDDFSVNILYNRMGPRLKFRGINGAGRNIFEKPRDVIDVQLSKKILNNKLEARLTVSDILAQAYTWYYNYEANPSNIKYDASKDKIMLSSKYGTTTALSLKYNFGK
ncbi:MAG: TonB-dependent receptor domain-containing protein [Ilyomonas sp.]